MWILSNGQSTTHFIRPGSRLTLGRKGEIEIRHQSVSKNHAELVAEAPESSSALIVSQPYGLTFKDTSSKGTLLNGEPVRNASKRILNKTILRFGADQTEWKLEFEPIVLTISMAANAADPGPKLRRNAERICHLGFKVSREFSRFTKVVISTKRNSAKTLHALAMGIYVATDAYLDHLVETYDKFDGIHIPDPSPFLPGGTPHAPEAFRPDGRRSSLFQDMTFIFVEEKQYQNLIHPITAAEGKAILVADPSNASFDDYAAKSNSVLVLPLIDESRFAHIAVQLHIATILQSAFLDFMLNLDRSVLRHPWLPDGDSNTAEATLTSSIADADGSREATREQEPTKSSASNNEPGRMRGKRFERQPLKSMIMDDIFEFNAGSDGKAHPENARAIKATSPKNVLRQSEPATSSNLVDDDHSEYQFAGVEMAKRRRLDVPNDAMAIDTPIEPSPTAESAQDSKKIRESKKAKTSSTERIKALKDTEDQISDPDDNEADYLGRNLGLVKTISISRAAREPRLYNDDWNGRKNFKGFRRRGERRTVRGAPTFVGLVPSDAAVMNRMMSGPDLDKSQTHAHARIGPVKSKLAHGSGSSDDDDDGLRFTFD